MHAQSNHGTFQEDMRIGEIKALFFCSGSDEAVPSREAYAAATLSIGPDYAARHPPDVIDVSISQVAGAQAQLHMHAS